MNIGVRLRESVVWAKFWPVPQGPAQDNRMRRISAIFIAACMVLIAGSIGAVLYLGFGANASTAAIVALAALTGMALFNSVGNRLRDRLTPIYCC